MGGRCFPSQRTIDDSGAVGLEEERRWLMLASPGRATGSLSALPAVGGFMGSGNQQSRHVFAGITARKYCRGNGPRMSSGLDFGQSTSAR